MSGLPGRTKVPSFGVVTGTMVTRGGVPGGAGAGAGAGVVVVLGFLVRMFSIFTLALLISSVIFGVFTSTWKLLYQPKNQPTTTKAIKAAAANAKRFLMISTSEFESGYRPGQAL